MTVKLPAQINAEDFHSYPPEAHSVVVKHLDLLREFPLSFLPLLLVEMISYDWRFPMERLELDQQLAYLGGLSGRELDTRLGGFSRLTLSAGLTESNWIDNPSGFIEQLSTHLWATHQMDSFRAVAEDYATAWRATIQPLQTKLQRLGIVVIGQGVVATDYPLFRKLRPDGVYFSNVSEQGGLQTLLTAVAGRASAYPFPYGHWYIDGGTAESVNPAVTTISYESLKPVRTTLLNHMQTILKSGSASPETLRSALAKMKPHDIGLESDGDAAVLGHFQMSLLTEGSGTQIFSTTFAQWAAREVLRRAQPATVMVRFAPRQRQQPMNELLSGDHPSNELDPEGSLLDADMAAYYTWINQQRLSDASQAVFLAWFEGHNQAVAISPSLPHGTVSQTPTTLQQIMTWIS